MVSYWLAKKNSSEFKEMWTQSPCQRACAIPPSVTLAADLLHLLITKEEEKRKFYYLLAVCLRANRAAYGRLHQS